MCCLSIGFLISVSPKPLLSVDFKIELDQKLAEKAQVGAMVNEVHVLRSLVEGTLFEEEPLVEELSLTATEQRRKDVDDAGKRLGEQLDKVREKMPLRASLSSEEQLLVQESEKEARDHVDRLNSISRALQQQMEVLDEWTSEKGQLDQQTSSLAEELKRIEDKYRQQPQSLRSAKDDLNRLEGLKGGAGQAKDRLIRIQSVLVQQFPRRERAEAELRPIEEQLIQLHADIGSTVERLRKGIESENKLLDERNALLGALRTLQQQTQQAHAIEDPHNKSSEMGKVQQQLEQLDTQLARLDDKCSGDPTKGSSPVISHSEFSLELAPVHEELKMLKDLLREEEKDVQRKLVNNAARARVARELTEVQLRIRRADNIREDPNSIVDDLKAAILEIEEAQPHMEALSQVLDSLQGVSGEEGDAQAILIRDEASAERMEQSERLGILLQSLRDQLQMLTQFDQEVVQIEANLKQIGTTLDELRAEGADTTVDTFVHLEADRAEQMNALIGVQSMLEEKALKHLLAPPKRLDELKQRGQELSEHLARKKAEMQKHSEHRATIRLFAQQLERLQKQKTELEQRLDRLQWPNCQELEQLGHGLLEPLKLDLDQMEAPPAEELERQRQQLRTALADQIEPKFEVKMAEARQTEEKVRQISEQITSAEHLLMQLRQHYNEGTKPLEVVSDDVGRLRAMNSKLSELSLEEVKQQPIRKQLADRLMPVRSQLNVSKPKEQIPAG